MRSWLIITFMLVFAPAVCGITILEPGYTTEVMAQYSNAASMAYSMTCDDAGNLYLSQPYANSIWRMKLDGTVGALVTDNFSSGIEWTGGTAYGDYLYSAANKEVVRIATDGTQSNFAGGLPGCSEIAVDRTGNYGGDLYVTTGGTDRIYRVDTSGVVSMFSSWPGHTSGGGPLGLAFDTTGNYGDAMYVGSYFAQSNASKSGLFVLDTGGNASRFSEDLVSVFEIALDTGGIFENEMYVVGRDSWDSSYSIWTVAPDGSASQFATTTYDIVGSLAFAPDGALYISEYLAAGQVVTITRVVPEPGTVLLVGVGWLGLRHRRRRVQ